MTSEVLWLASQSSLVSIPSFTIIISYNCRAQAAPQHKQAPFTARLRHHNFFFPKGTIEFCEIKP
jgi:hypothetical protein